jgi:bacteriocin-like protein
MSTENQDNPDVSTEQPDTTKASQLSDDELKEISGGVHKSGAEGWIEI